MDDSIDISQKIWQERELSSQAMFQLSDLKTEKIQMQKELLHHRVSDRVLWALLHLFKAHAHSEKQTKAETKNRIS